MTQEQFETVLIKFIDSGVLGGGYILHLKSGIRFEVYSHDCSKDDPIYWFATADVDEGFDLAVDVTDISAVSLIP